MREQSGGGRLCFAFPHHDDAVTHGLQCPLDSPIPRAVRSELLEPELSISLGRRCPAARRVTVPETAVNEDGPSPLAVGKIGGPREVPVPDPVAVAQSKDGLADNQLGARVTLAHATEPF